MTERAEIASARRWVVKVGSALLTDDGRGLDVDVISALVKQLAQLRESGCEVVLVSSGAVAAGIVRLSWDARPQLIHELQAAAAVGQSALVQSYETAFKRYGIATAQILLVHDDVVARDRYLNARRTLQTLLKLGWCPSSMRTIPWSQRKSALEITIRWQLWWPTLSMRMCWFC